MLLNCTNPEPSYFSLFSNIIATITGVILGGFIAYYFDRRKRIKEDENKRKDELIKICNELILFCENLEFYTKEWFNNFIMYHYYLQYRKIDKDPLMSTLMHTYLQTHKEIRYIIADFNAKSVYYFDEIYRLKKIDFGEDRKFLSDDYKIEYDNKIFNDIYNDHEIEKKKEVELNKANKKFINEYKPVLDRVKKEVKEIKN